ncbi:hypothetical protein Pcinc_025539 [Petrolisthes cinctipes]|uniref:SGNH hydrolase-type esterase domain-containing protein n=1 Tax=Petrolisthes cinctipes TaxID=88211 RepID=A0AAE1F922_PETCI|nr:hypothetical protein Pcinc_025539 [Petrolisthes cinctipes]
MVRSYLPISLLISLPFLYPALGNQLSIWKWKAVDKKLNNGLLMKSTGSKIMCTFACIIRADCVSYNHKDDGMQCELLNTGMMNIGQLTNASGWSYMTQVPPKRVSGNDLFLRNGETGNTEEIILDAMYMVDELKRFNRTAVIGILPRLGVGSHALSKAIGVNERLEDMCTPLGVRFVDPYNVFYGRADLYLPNGVHLNKRGKEVFGDMVNQVVYRVVRSTHVVREGRQPNDSDAPEVTPIEVTPPLEKRVGASCQNEGGSSTEGTPVPEVVAPPSTVADAANLSLVSDEPSGNVSG